MKCLAVDLVILNDRAPSHVQDLQVLARDARANEPVDAARRGVGSQGKVFTLGRIAVTAAQRDVLRGAARVELSSRRGTLAEQVARVHRADAVAPAQRPRAPRPVQR